MSCVFSRRTGSILALIAGVFLWPAIGAAQTVNGQAAAVQATVFNLFGSTALGLASTGTLGGTTDARDASQLSGNLLGALVAEVPQATTIGWPDQVSSQASLANLSLNIAGSNISADFLSSEAMANLNAGGSGSSILTNLQLNGTPVTVNGAPNQAIAIPGGRIVVNEQQPSPGGIVVTALHVVVGGVADVMIGTATAGIQ
ncbi:MAG TPA: choice-of-anchor P family protein [Burkholderiales bacterium]|jgi:hypothetical protein